MGNDGNATFCPSEHTIACTATHHAMRVFVEQTLLDRQFVCSATSLVPAWISRLNFVLTDPL
jgi:hypothetical protein